VGKLKGQNQKIFPDSESPNSSSSPYKDCPLPPRPEPEILKASTHRKTPNTPKGTEIEFDGTVYQSASEVACGVLLHRYIPGFKVVKGETYDIPLYVNEAGGVISADFLVSEALLEYHPPRLKGGDYKPGEARRYSNQMKAAGTPEERKQIKLETKLKLADNYREKRLEQISASEEHSQRELIVATSPEELYQKVILRFVQHPPSKDTFLKEFRRIKVKAAKKLRA